MHDSPAEVADVSITARPAPSKGRGQGPAGGSWRCLLLAAVLLLTSARDPVAGPGSSATWPQWRGPERTGEVAPSTTWSADLKNVQRLWRQELGKGYPGPIVAENRVFAFETVDDATAAVRALDRATGQELWTHSWAATGSVPFFAAENGDWVRSTPAFDGTTLYVGDMQEKVLALDGKTGAVRWMVDMPARFGTPPPDFGFASSPLVDGDDLYLQAANSVIKLNARNGETVWRVLEAEASAASGGAFSSPVLATIRGVRQLVVATREGLHGIDPATGRVLWSQPVASFRGMNILTPTVHEDAVFTSAYGGASNLYRITRGDGGFGVEPAWSNKATAYMSSPVVIDGHAYLHLRNQRLDCIDLASGESRWRTEGFGKYWSLAYQGDKILALDQTGELLLLRADPEGFDLLDEHTVSEQPTWGHIAVAGDQIFIRELQALAAYRWRAAPAGE